MWTRAMKSCNLCATSWEQSPDVTDHYTKAAATFDPALTGPNGGPQSQNASMHDRFARILAQLSTLDESSPDVLKKDQDRSAKEIELARKLVKPADKDYLEINDFAANLAMRRGDRAG